jgi:hypothetical protein
VEPNQHCQRTEKAKARHQTLSPFPFQIPYCTFFSIYTISCSHPLVLVILGAFLLLLVNIKFFSILKQAMGDAILSALASKIMGNLNSPILQDLGLAGGLKTELENLNNMLRTIQAVLQDAEEKQWKSEPINCGRLQQFDFLASHVCI